MDLTQWSCIKHRVSMERKNIDQKKGMCLPTLACEESFKVINGLAFA